jgi:thiamine biosynthesis lipoprotein
MVGSCILLLWAASCAPRQLQRFERSGVQFNTPINLIFYTSDEKNASEAAQAAFDLIAELEYVFTDWRPESELRQLCAKSDGKTPIKVSDHLFRVLQQAQQMSERSGGTFDVTIGPVVKRWRQAIRQKKLPKPEKLAEAMDLVGYRLVHLNPKDQTVLLDKPNMRLDLGGIAKGYIIDQVLALFKKRGIDHVLVDIGGDMAMGDPPPGKEGWIVAVAPLEGLAADGSNGPFRRLTLSNCAVATSGDTEKFVEIDGRRYSHLIDPRTGIGITDHSNVTIIAPDATTADALASTVSILGPTEGLKLIEKTPDTEALIFRQPEDKLEVYHSPGFPEK